MSKKEICRPELSELYNKLLQYSKIGKIRWYRENRMSLELTELTMANIKPNKLENLVFGLAFKVENDKTKFWIEIMNTDMVSIRYEKENPKGEDRVIQMNDGSEIKIWKDFLRTL